jgi:hypothetical protein
MVADCAVLQPSTHEQCCSSCFFVQIKMTPDYKEFVNYWLGKDGVQADIVLSILLLGAKQGRQWGCCTL